VEQIGMQRAWQEIHQADRILLMIDSNTTENEAINRLWPEFIEQLQDTRKLTLVRNKIDLTHETTGLRYRDDIPVIYLSAKTQLGMIELKQHLKDVMGYDSTTEGGFLARRRHLEALARAEKYLLAGAEQLHSHGAGELLAEDLRGAQNALSEITGAFSSDDLLGRIFGSFCIGK